MPIVEVPRVTSPVAFDNRFVREIPGDPNPTPEIRQVHGAGWSAVLPTPVPRPTLIAHSPEVAALVGLSDADVAAPWFPAVFGGNALLDGMEPYAACYGGHQFGSWAGQLGDGRAITLGEVRTSSGERWELQLKGAGPTPYARRADGRAVLRSSIREFLCSEAMHHLGVPTTRALSLVATGEPVLRDMFYDGNPRLEPGAIVCRVAPSFIRFGTFELPAARRDLALLRQLVDFTIDRDFPQVARPRADDAPRGLLADEARRGAWFAEVCERTAILMVEWMRVGFVHGVMNTDNMSVLGLTIDYGPYGWLDDFNPQWTPNTTDAAGRRYRYANQPSIAQWNLERLANAIAPLFGEVEQLHYGLDRFVDTFAARYDAMLADKLGAPAVDHALRALADDGLRLLASAEVDYTNFFRALAAIGGSIPETDDALLASLGDVFYDEAKRTAHGAALAAWVRRWHSLVTRGGSRVDERQGRMRAANPKFVLRNYLAQQAIDRAEAGDVSMVHELLDVMRRPYDEQPGREAFAARRPDWARHRAGSSMLSCSS
jgi:serine/tyrosine/threonine adenylyltransferase